MSSPARAPCPPRPFHSIRQNHKHQEKKTLRKYSVRSSVRVHLQVTTPETESRTLTQHQRPVTHPDTDTRACRGSPISPGRPAPANQGPQGYYGETTSVSVSLLLRPRFPPLLCCRTASRRRREAALGWMAWRQALCVYVCFLTCHWRRHATSVRRRS